MTVKAAGNVARLPAALLAAIVAMSFAWPARAALFDDVRMWSADKAE